MQPLLTRLGVQTDIFFSTDCMSISTATRTAPTKSLRKTKAVNSAISGCLVSLANFADDRPSASTSLICHVNFAKTFEVSQAPEMS